MYGIVNFLMNRMPCKRLLNSKEYSYCAESGIGGITSKGILDTDGKTFPIYG